MYKVFETDSLCCIECSDLAGEKSALLGLRFITEQQKMSFFGKIQMGRFNVSNFYLYILFYVIMIMCIFSSGYTELTLCKIKRYVILWDRQKWDASTRKFDNFGIFQVTFFPLTHRIQFKDEWYVTEFFYL